MIHLNKGMIAIFEKKNACRAPIRIELKIDDDEQQLLPFSSSGPDSFLFLRNDISTVLLTEF